LSVLWPIVLSLVVLVATGWWIGHQIAFDAALVRARPLTIVMAPGTLPGKNPGSALGAALRRGAPSIHDIIFLNERPVEGRFVHLTRTLDTRFHNIQCRPGTLHPQSCALQRVSIGAGPAPCDWHALATIILQHMAITTSFERDSLAGPAFERHYLAAWHHMQTADGEMHRAYRNLSAALDQWPVDRDDEKSVALANLAVLCLRLPEPPATRLPRLLEGLDAARTALRMRVDLPADAQISGLRELIADLRRGIAITPGEAFVAAGARPAQRPVSAPGGHTVTHH